MLSLCTELYLIISKNFNDKDKIAMSMTAKKLFGLRDIFTYDSEVDFDAIRKLPYFNNFTNVKMGEQYVSESGAEILPLKCERVHAIVHDHIPLFKTIAGKCVNTWHITFNDNFNTVTFDTKSAHIFRTSVTHLTFSKNFNCLMYYYIPNNIIYLDFGYHFNKYIYPPVLKLIKYLKFGKCYNQDADFSLLKNLIHLTFGDDFDRSVTNKLPSSLTHLTFGSNFNQQINNIPSSVTHLTFTSGYKFVESIPSTVTFLVINGKMIR